MNANAVPRREALKALAAATLAARLPAAIRRAQAAAGKAAQAGPSALRFFTPAEQQMADRLLELIIPADAHSPGASAARVSWYADQVLAESDAGTQQAWRSGLATLAAAQDLPGAVAVAAQGELHPTLPLHHFFIRLKHMAVEGFYTSEIGLLQDLQYQGNTYVADFEGCTHPAHRATTEKI